MKKSILVLLLILVSDIHSQTGWFVVPSFTSQNLYDCKATAVYSLSIASDNGTIFRSTNSSNWFVHNFNDPLLNNSTFKYVLGQNGDSWVAVGANTGCGFSNGSIDSVFKISNLSPLPTLEAFSYLSGWFFYSANIAAGSGGKFFIQDPASPYWRSYSTPATLANGRNINYSWGSIFVGNGGLIMMADSIGLSQPDGTAIKWKIIPSGTSANINAVMGGGGSPNFYAVGDNGLILKSTDNGYTWGKEVSPTTENLYGVWSGYALLACGANGTILRNYFGKWYKQNSPTTEDLYFVHTLSYSDYIAGGRNGIFLRTTDGGGSLKRFITNSIIEGFFNTANYTMIPDTISVTVRAAASPYNIIGSGKGRLNVSALIDIPPTVLNGVQYWIQINHRNTIETWSKTTQIFTNNDMYYDFYNSAAKAYGNNQKQLGSWYGFYSGDVNQDGTVDLTDNQLIDNDASNFVSGYVNTDVTGDNFVDLIDASIADNNAYNFVNVMRP